MNPTNDATKANFFSNLEPDPEHPGCIKHKKANKNKYYALKVNGKKVEAHRFVYLVTKGDIPAGFDVHHACENKRCVNIEHLECLPHEKHTKHHTATQFKKGNSENRNVQKMYCPRGHRYDMELFRRNGSFKGRNCTICRPRNFTELQRPIIDTTQGRIAQNLSASSRVTISR